MAVSHASKNKITAASFGAGINLVLFIAKLYIGLSTNSIAIYADALGSIADFAVCAAAIVGFCMLKTDKNESFPFGLGKIEDLLNLIISAVILITGAAFVYISFERLLYPVPVWYSQLYSVLIAATAAVKLGLAFFYKAMLKKTGASTIKNLQTDSMLDFFITLCTLVSFTLSAKTSFSVDGLAGVIIGIILAAEGLKMTFASAAQIIGKNDRAECEKMKALIETDDAVDAVRSIQCHRYGETAVFTAEITAACESAEEISALSQRLNSLQSNAKIYLKLGGKDEEK